MKYFMPLSSDFSAKSLPSFLIDRKAARIYSGMLSNSSATKTMIKSLAPTMNMAPADDISARI